MNKRFNRFMSLLLALLMTLSPLTNIKQIKAAGGRDLSYTHIDDFTISKSKLQNQEILDLDFKFSGKDSDPIKEGDYIEVKIENDSSENYISFTQDTKPVKDQNGEVIGTAHIYRDSIRVIFNEKVEKLNGKVVEPSSVQGFGKAKVKANISGSNDIVSTINIGNKKLEISLEGITSSTPGKIQFFDKSGYITPSEEDEKNNDKKEIDWTLYINRGKYPTGSGVPYITVEDTIGKGHKLIEDSIEVKVVEHHENEGDLTTTYKINPSSSNEKELSKLIEDKNFILSVKENKIAISIPSENVSYTSFFIMYKTEIVDLKQDDFKNSAKATYEYYIDQVLIKDIDKSISRNVQNQWSDFGIEMTIAKDKELVIRKLDSIYKQPLKDVEFSLYNEKTKEVREGKTNEKGEIIFTGLEDGKYELKEIKVPDSINVDGKEYKIIISDEIYDIEMDNSKGVNKEITNEIKELPEEDPNEKPPVEEPPIEEPTVPVEPPVEEPTVPVEPPVEEPTVPDEGISIDPIVPPVDPIVPIEPEVPSIPEEEEETGVLPNIKRPEKDDEGVLGQLNEKPVTNERPIKNEEEVNRPVYKEETSNPKTGDSGIFMYISLIVLGVIALMATKRKQTNN